MIAHRQRKVVVVKTTAAARGKKNFGLRWYMKKKWGVNKKEVSKKNI